MNAAGLKEFEAKASAGIRQAIKKANESEVMGLSELALTNGIHKYRSELMKETGDFYWYRWNAEKQQVSYIKEDNDG